MTKTVLGHRLAALRESPEAGEGALIVSSLTNIRWLTGFSGSNGWLAVRKGRAVLITDGRYGEQARDQLAAAGVECEVAVGRSQAQIMELLRDAVGTNGVVSVESEHVTWAEQRRLQATLGRELTPTAGVVEAHRREKDDAEIEAMATACRIADEALRLTVPLLSQRPTEREVRDELERNMRRLGADGPSYETIVATGPINAPQPHHRPDHTVVEEGHTVIIDVGALVDGYHSDMTRTFFIGEPSPLAARVYEAVRAAQQAGVDALAAGLRLQELDGVCRRIIADAGFGEWFLHGTGHGVGLLIHEDPFVNATAEGTLRVGDVVTVEPGVYRGDFGGVRIEDLVVVTSDGPRVLTQFPKDQPCLPSPPTT